MNEIHPLYYLWEHKATVFLGLMTVVTAAIATSPVPKSAALLWLYDFAHQVFNVKNTRLAKEPIPTPPQESK